VGKTSKERTSNFEQHLQPSGAAGQYSRRDFLKMGLLAAATPILLPGSPRQRFLQPREAPATATQSAPPTELGRIIAWRMPVRETPARNAPVVAYKSRDELIPLNAAVEGEAPWPSNPIWYDTEEGYVHSGQVQPVREMTQPVIRDVPDTGFWAEVTMPWADARWSPTQQWRAFRLYYGTIYRVIATVVDDDGQAWYRLKEGVSPWRPGPYVPADRLRRIAPDELTPISPGHPDKRILIDLQEQMLYCQENEETVFRTQVATGRPGSWTPRGEFRVTYKRHTRRMTVQDIASPYDLPGVPYTIYFNWTGVAIHGTYWHNDYGRIQSNGCVNTTPDHAKWIFRWVEPQIDYEDYTQFASDEQPGTRVTVV
jgi:lipoprotein-anchoring transpeptidase ErfK/SrfK